MVLGPRVVPGPPVARPVPTEIVLPTSGATDLPKAIVLPKVSGMVLALAPPGVLRRGPMATGPKVNGMVLGPVARAVLGTALGPVDPVMVPGPVARGVLGTDLAPAVPVMVPGQGVLAMVLGPVARGERLPLT